MIRAYAQLRQAQGWLNQYRGKRPLFACVLGFTETGSIPGISAAGATPTDRRYTAIADADFLYRGPSPSPPYPLPPLTAGASPAFISRAVIACQNLPIHLFNAGLPVVPVVPCIDLGGEPANCLSQGQALEFAIAQHLFQQGLHWGQQLANEASDGYLILGECVVGGTTTALAILSGLGIDAAGRANSSHPICNHTQKWQVVQQGLEQAYRRQTWCQQWQQTRALHPLKLVSAVGDPMQAVVAGITIAASRHCGVLLAGGTQMLAVYALTRAIAQYESLPWQAQQVVVGTTRWVAEDASGDTVGLAQKVGHVPLLGAQLNFSRSRYPSLRAYEAGYVKEGVGAGGCAIASHLYQNWDWQQLLLAVEAILENQIKINPFVHPEKGGNEKSSV